jgi:hypothetical protein
MSDSQFNISFFKFLGLILDHAEIALDIMRLMKMVSIRGHKTWFFFSYPTAGISDSVSFEINVGHRDNNLVVRVIRERLV